MLPNRMNLFKSTEDQLKRLKQQTGITPNYSARIAFSKSYESGFVYNLDNRKPDGALNLDKLTWFGDYLELFELLLAYRYPKLQGKDLEKAWAAHVEDGLSSLRSRKKLVDFVG